MKKELLTIIIFLLLFGFASYADDIVKLKAEMEFYQNKLYDVEDYVKSLKDKIETAKNAKKKAALNALLSKQEERTSVLEREILLREEQISKLESTATVSTSEAKTTAAAVPASTIAPAKKPGFSMPKGLIAGVGLKAGTTSLGLGIAPEFSPTLPRIGKVETRINADYGIGNSYSILLLQMGGTTDTGKGNYTGLTLDIVNYSNRIKSIPGLTYVIEKGVSLGASIFWGRAFGKFAIEAGYSNVLGFVGGVRYKL